MAQSEIAATKEALHQYIIIRKLYTELEEEREASATSANEALSMIVRLQREKAEEKMEACQYKRIAEEKMHHAEQCLTILEEALQQKEFEVLILQHQLHLYKRKLLSNGINDLDFGDIITCENLSSCGARDLLDKTDLCDHVGRNISLPSLRLQKVYSEIDSNENSPFLPSGQVIWKIIGDYTDQLSDKNKEILSVFQESATDDHHYKEVNGKLRYVRYESSTGRNEHQTIAINSSLSSGAESSCSWYSAESGDMSCHSKLGTKIHLDAEGVSSLPFQAEEHVKTAESAGLYISHDQIEMERNTFQSACVHDIFEVPNSDRYHTNSEPKELFMEESIKETKKCLERAFTYTNCDCGISNPMTEVSIPEPNKLSSPRKGEMMNCNSVLVDSVYGTCFMQNDLEHIKSQLQQIECEKIIETEDSDKGDIQLKLLRTICEQLNKIESQLKNSDSKKFPQQEESQIVNVMEAFLSFSI